MNKRFEKRENLIQKHIFSVYSDEVAFSFMHISICVNFPYIQICHIILRDDIQNLYFLKDIYAKIDIKIDPTTFANQTDDKQEIEKDCKSILHMMTPLKFDISSANLYILTGVDIRLRFDLAPAKLIINSYNNADYSYIVHSVKLWK